MLTEIIAPTGITLTVLRPTFCVRTKRPDDDGLSDDAATEFDHIDASFSQKASMKYGMVSRETTRLHV
jgi:hypothetical protein